MKWLIVAPDLRDENIKIVEDFLDKEKGCEYVHVFADDGTKTADELLDDMRTAATASQCIVISADKMSQNSDFKFAMGLLAGRCIPTFIHGKAPSLLRYKVSDLTQGAFLRFYDTAEELVSVIRQNYDQLEQFDIQRQSLTSLLIQGIPFTSDSYALYLQKEKEEICSLIMKAGMNVNAFTSEGVPLLCIATRNDNCGQIKILLENGADVNAVSKDRGYTPVMDAVWRKNPEATKILIEAGAKLDIMSSDGQPIMVLAVGNGNEEIAELLLKSGADPDTKDSMGMSARQYASLFKKQGLVDLIEKYNPNGN